MIYLPFLQQAFSTEPLRSGDWLICAAVASTVLWLRELGKLAVAALPAGSGQRQAGGVRFD